MSWADDVTAREPNASVPVHISRLLRAQVRYVKCSRAACALKMKATPLVFFQARPRFIEIKISTFENAASVFLAVTESAQEPKNVDMLVFLAHNIKKVD